MKALVIIPSRLNSSRLHQKAIADIAGKPMVVRVLECAVKAGIGDVIVATCGNVIADIAIAHNAKAIITHPDLPSGTDRVWAAYQELGKPPVDIIINVQGDLPFLNPSYLKAILKPFANPNVDVATIAAPIQDPSEIHNPNVVKIAMDEPQNGIARAVYFSRQAIPANAEQLYHHIGVYAYRPHALEQFINHPLCYLEKTERLEQLRFLQYGFRIDVALVNEPPITVDTLEDLNKAREMAAQYV